MNILLIGGSSSLINQLIIKLKKEGNRIYLLTGNKYRKDNYARVFEKYYFDYDSENLTEVFDSVDPDVTIFMGAYDTNFQWKEEQKESVRFTSGLMNILVAYSMVQKGRFILLSSDDVYGVNYPEDITEEQLPSAIGFKGMALAQGEELCENYRKNLNLDLVVLRIAHLYHIPKDRDGIQNICAQMCLNALESEYITANSGSSFSMLYESDAVEFIYRVAQTGKLQHSLYHLSSSVEISEVQIADIIADCMGKNINVVDVDSQKCRRILSNKRFDEEFGVKIFGEYKETISKMAVYMRRHKDVFLTGMEEKKSVWQRFKEKSWWLIRALIPFLENIICFIPFFMLNNRAVGSDYFSNLDFYLLYVLLFAICYGQQQATFSAVLAVAGYCFRQMYERSGFDVMLDYNTYVWMAQLFILGLVVGYMRDEIRTIRLESEEEKEHLNRQLEDILDINSSNVRVKDVLERQVIDQRDSIGKIYSITSALDQYMPDEVLFYAVEMLSNILNSRDVAIYTVINDSYARMFSASSKKARELGNSIRYKEMGEMYNELLEHKVYINRTLNQNYPLMANAIYENDKMQMIIMIWGIPWERMTLGQANMLTVVSYLIQNAVLRANRYMSALEDRRYVEDTKILEPEAFSSLVRAYEKAKAKNLTECTLLKINVQSTHYDEVGNKLANTLRQTDYMGTMEDGHMYVLLANANKSDAGIVMSRIAKAGYDSEIVEKVKG